MPGGDDLVSRYLNALAEVHEHQCGAFVSAFDGGRAAYAARRSGDQKYLAT
jgi:hypothetical protein